MAKNYSIGRLFSAARRAMLLADRPGSSDSQRARASHLYEVYYKAVQAAQAR